jgi:hypothetical protein
MIFGKAVVVVLLGLGPFAFQEEPSKAVRAKLFKQVLAEDAELRECLKEQEGGISAAALPDTYLVGARAGQVMRVQLTAPRKSVRFLVMSPKSTSLLADNTRSWSGTLPETGDYHIIVDADERGGTYAMTISVR